MEIVEVNHLNIRAIKEHKGISLESLAEKAGISYHTLTTIVGPRKSRYNKEVIVKLADALEVSYEILLKDGILPKEYYAIPYSRIAKINPELMRAYRAKKRYSMRFLAKKADVTFICIFRCENEDIGYCSWKNLIKITRALGIKPDAILEDTPWPDDLEPCLKKSIHMVSNCRGKYKRPLLPIGKLFADKGYNVPVLREGTGVGVCSLRLLFWGQYLPSDQLLKKIQKFTGILIGEMKYAYSVSVKLRDINKEVYGPVSKKGYKK
jgi:transcriptional regulator with XRE-family HTH domain